MSIDRVVLARGGRALMNEERDVVSGRNPPWRAALGRELVWLLAAKLAALTLIWALFFRR